MYHRRYTRKRDQSAGPVHVEGSVPDLNMSPGPYMTVKEL